MQNYNGRSASSGRGAQFREWAGRRDVFVQQEVLLRLSRALVAVVLQFRTDRDGVVLLEQPSDLTQRRSAFSFGAEEDAVECQDKYQIRSQLTGTMARERNGNLLEDPLGLENDSDPRCMTRATNLMGRCLNDTEHRLARETEAPLVRIDILRDVLWPWLGIQLCDAVKHLPVRVVVLIHRPRVVSLLRKENEGGVGTVVARGRKVKREHVGELFNVALIGKVVGVDECVDLIVSFVALRGVDAGENEVIVEEDLGVVVVSIALPGAGLEELLDLRSRIVHQRCRM